MDTHRGLVINTEIYNSIKQKRQKGTLCQTTKQGHLNGTEGHRIVKGFFIVSEPTVFQDIGFKVASVDLKHCNIYNLHLLNHINNYDHAFIV